MNEKPAPAAEAPDASAKRGRSRGLAWVNGVLLAAGVALLGVAGYGIATALAGDAEAGSAADAVQPETPAPAAEAEEAPEPRGIAELTAPSWVAETGARTGIPTRALAAYSGAAMQVQREQPGCGIDWTTLAGIGHVESGHGTIFGGAIDERGMQVPAVLGIALNGVTTNAIPDTDGGALDGDAQWDRAVGPMQIIPETWERYGADGNGDGARDPQQIDDAALTAARYLCAVGVDLSSSEGWIAAVSAYNDTVDYNHRVAEATSAYRAG